MWIDRDLEGRLRHAARTRPVVVLTGARQTGKTSTLRRLFPDHRFVSLDLPTEAALAEHEPEAFLRRHPPPVIVDEVQYAPALFRHLKAAVDAHRGRKGQFLLTGSQKFTVMAGVSESLAGRADIIELGTLSLAEIRRVHATADVDAVILRGGFPELHANPDIDAVAFYASYLATYLERDVRSLANVGSLRDFERFLRACALRSANLLNKADLARDIGIAPSTASQWLSVLEASGQIVLLEPWFSKLPAGQRPPGDGGRRRRARRSLRSRGREPRCGAPACPPRCRPHGLRGPRPRGRRLASWNRTGHSVMALC